MAVALLWFRKAVKQGQAEAAQVIGEYYRYGFGVKKDYVAMLYWYKNAHAQVILGQLYVDGDAVAADLNQAIYWYSKAAGFSIPACFDGPSQAEGDAFKIRANTLESSHLHANSPPLVHFFNDIKSSSNTTAPDWFRRMRERLPGRSRRNESRHWMPEERASRSSADNASIYTASTFIGDNNNDFDRRSLLSRRSSVSTLCVQSPANEQHVQQKHSSQDPVSSETTKDDLCKKTTEGSQLPSGNVYYESYMKHLVESKLKAAERGDLKSQVEMGQYYLNGMSVRKDYAKAMEWFRRAAKKGYAAGQFMVGHMYYCGRGVDQDMKEGAAWFRKAAHQGHSEGEYELGKCYLYGHGVEHDAAQALYWQERAANQGYPYAQASLGYQYAHGFKVPLDLDRAIYWYSKAVDQNFANTRESLNEILEQKAKQKKVGEKQKEAGTKK
ncbi:hypothetical protein BGZ73_003726 [Actinomortierella ambigua]|nr:hypothetical protein BGZ73_003726 [Actinomortierella ambigua]